MIPEAPFSYPVPGTQITPPVGVKGVTYTVGNLIASGYYGYVYEGFDSFENNVVLKVCKPVKSFVEIQQAWQKEVIIFNQVNHPNIVTIYDSFISENLFYIVLEKARENIFQWRQNQTTVEPYLVRETARQLLSGLHYLHKNSILHRDLTVYNCLIFHGSIDERPIIKISDFGISEKLFQTSDQHQPQTVHPQFIPPELLLDECGDTDERSDLYHLGLILLYVATGWLPNINNDDVRAGIPRQRAEQIGTPLGNYISVLLRRNNEYRFHTAIDAWNALRLPAKNN